MGKTLFPNKTLVGLTQLTNRLGRLVVVREVASHYTTFGKCMFMGLSREFEFGQKLYGWMSLIRRTSDGFIFLSCVFDF